MLLRIDVLYFASEEDALALRQGLRLDDEGPALSLGLGVVVGFEFLEIPRQVPSEREVVILIGILLPHLHEVLGEQVLPRERVHAWKVVDFLMVFHLHEHLGRDCPVRPPNIPLAVIHVRLHLPLQLLPHLRHHLVLAV